MNNSMLISILTVVTAALFIICIAVVVFFAKRMAQIKQSALRDAATGGLNFAGLQAKAGTVAIEEYAVVTAKLMNWPQILETFSSEDAERVLRYIHTQLSAGLSASEFLARIGGGNFCILMRNREAEVIRTRLERMEESLNRFNESREIRYEFDMRFGAYLPTADKESFSAVCEMSLRYAEESGPDGVRIGTANREEGADKRWAFASQIDTAIQNGDFFIYLQPKVSLSDGRVSGAEAFVRWRHPHKGLLTSAMFVPELEEYHVIDRLDKFVFESVCRRQAEWKQAGLQLSCISVNLSLDTLKRKNFAGEYAAICRRYGVDTKLMEFELNEKLLRETKEFICEVIKNVHDHGFKCSFDNFGNTAIPLRLMRELEVDAIKLERSFFSVENNNRKNRFLIEAILKFAAQMGISTVAEGIENISQVRYLQQTGCDMVQGFCFFNPMAPDEYRNTVYSGKELVYVQLNRDDAEEESAFNKEDGGIAMFSYSTIDDRIVFSECFSPALGGKKEHENAGALFTKSGLIHENDIADLFLMLDRCKNGSINDENILRFYVAEGRYEWLTVRLHRVTSMTNGEAVIAGTLVNKNLWKKEAKRWQDRATRDAMTGLFNRAYFEKTVSEGIEKGDYETGALAFIDVDDFKKINDSMGHLVGDDVLQYIAKRLLGEFRHSDVVARYAGDEFIVYVNGISREDVEKRLAHLCQSFTYPYRNGNKECNVTISIGVAMYPENTADYKTLVKMADTALYRVKGQAKNGFTFYQPGMDAARLRSEE